MSSTKTSNELKSCPFCGSIAKIETGIQSDKTLYWVSCSNNNCAISPSGWMRETEERAIDDWNCREVF